MEETVNKDQTPIEPEGMAENQAADVEIQEPGTPESNTNQELKELRDKYLRLLAEFENFKKRSARERIEFSKYASQELMTSLLTVIDDMERESKSGAATEGSKLIHNKLIQILKQKGLVEMVSTGEPFDATLHEAITELPVDESQKNKIIDTVEKGYYLSDKIIRYAKVVVGK
jgi:molecular chaperone GrpE